MDRALALVVLCGSLLGSCGDDTSQPGPGAGSSGAAASGGKPGGEASAGVAATLPGLLPSEQLSAVPCGTAMCASPGLGLGIITACCADEGTSTCGTTSPSGACVKPRVGDPRCPALVFRGLVSVPSCCTASGACGLDGSMFGTPGCTDLASAAAQASAMRVVGVSIPSPRPCDPVGAAHPDAGSADAGT